MHSCFVDTSALHRHLLYAFCSLIIFQYSLPVSGVIWDALRISASISSISCHETAENRTKNRKSNNYLGYLCEIGWMLSAALYNTRSNVDLISKEGEWNETLWINENIENADVNNSLITKMADVAQWNILLGKTNAHEWITPKLSYPSPKGLNTGVPKWVHEGKLITKLPGGGKKMQQTTKWRNKMAISEITAQGTKC